MAISSKVEEIILELTRTIGNIYDALNYGIGDNDTPDLLFLKLTIYYRWQIQDFLISEF
jgi:hypothetical protein